MATVTNNFDTGLAAGTTITAANSDDGGAGTAFDFVSGGGTKTFETRDSGLYGRFTSVGSGTAYAEYSTAVGSLSGPIYGSGDFLIPVLPPSGGARLVFILTAADAGIAEWRISDTGKLEQRTGAGGLVNTSVNSITAGQWFKVHFTVLTISATVGQLQCRLFLDPTSTTPTETLTSTADLDLGSTAAGKYRFGTVRTLTDFATGVDNVRFSDTSELPVTAGVLLGPVCGNMSDDGFTVSYRTTESAGLDHRLVVSTTSDLATSPVYSSVQVPDADGFVKLDVTGLSSGTLYYYGLEVDSTVLAAPVGRGSVWTDPPEGSGISFSVAFGSCQYDEPTTVTFDAIKDYSGPHGQVRRLIHMGDLNYQDWTTGDTAADMIAQHQTSLASASMAEMLSQIAMTYTPDNHDWGGSFSDSSLSVGPTVASVYRQVFPHYPLSASDGIGMWHSWVLGRVRFIQLDTRSQRDPYDDPNGPSKTMLGAEQKAWFKAQLLEPEPVKIVCGGILWREGSLTNDRWGSYPDEFDELNDYIAANPVGGVYVIFGDRHALCADDGSTLIAGQSTRGIPQAGGAPFQQGSTPIAETWSQGYYDEPGTMEAFGVLDITDAAAAITVTYTGYTSTDMVARVTMETTFDVDQNLYPTSIAPVAAVGSPTVIKGPVAVTAAGVASSEAFGQPTVTPGPVIVTTSGAGSVLAFGLPAVTVQATLRPTGIATGLAFGTATITRGPVAVTASGVGSSEAFGLPEAEPGPVALHPSGLGSGAAFGLPSLGAPDQHLTATGITSRESFGAATISVPQTLVASSVDPGAAVGEPYTFTGPVTLTPAGIGSVLDFGLPAATTGDVTVTATGAASALAWGLASVTQTIPDQTLSPDGVATGEAFGLPGTIIGSVTMRATGIAPTAALGTPTSGVGPVTLVVTGVATGEAFGDTHIIGGNDGQVAHATSVPSAEAFGSALVFIGNGGDDCECAVLVGA